MKTLNEICCSIADGDHQAPPKSDTGVPFVTISCLDPNGGAIDYSGAACVPREYYESLPDNRKAKAGDVLLSVVGSLGIPYLVKDGDEFAFQRHIAILRPGNDVLPKYLYYLLKSPELFHVIDSIAQGAAQRTLTLTQLRGLEVEVPDISKQEKVVAILSTYDDLIDNSRKQIKLLEEAAQRLYREWFVDMRFPSHEDVEFVDGLPEGWKRVPAVDLCEISIGKTPPRKEAQWFSDQGIKWASVADLGKCASHILNTAECLTVEAVKRHNVKVVPEGTILLSFKMTIGRIAIAAEDMATNEAIAHFRVEDSLRSYIFEYLANFQYDCLGSTSSISTAINSKIVKAIPIVVPSDEILNAFAEIADGYLSQMLTLQKMADLLQEARDRLLPKLMSGEIEV